MPDSPLRSSTPPCTRSPRTRMSSSRTQDWRSGRRKARELTMSTYVGNGVAIPHGTFEDKTLILSTGVAVAQFPHGVNWDGSNVAHLVVGIAAIREEHIGVLANLARVLEDEAVSKMLWTTVSSADVYETLGRPWQEAPDPAPSSRGEGEKD